VTLPPSVSVANLTFHTGKVMTALSEVEQRILHGAFHPETPKEPIEHLNDNLILTYAIGAKDYFSPLHLPRDLPEQMRVTCALDQSLNLNRVIIADLKGHIYCDASFEPPATPALALGEQGSLSTREVASGPGSPVRTAFSSPAASQYALRDARAQFSAVARTGSSLAAAAPLSGAPQAPATNKKSATDAQIEAQLRNKHGKVRSGREVGSVLRASGLSSSTSRITTQLRKVNVVRPFASASDDQLQKELRNPDGTIRTNAEVTAALHARGLGAGLARMTPMMQAIRGVRHLPTATDDQVKAQLKNLDDTPRSVEEALTALRATGVGVSSNRMTELMQAERGMLKRPAPSDDQIRTQLVKFDGTLKSTNEVEDALSTAGLGANPNRIGKLRRKLLLEATELQQPAATGSQVGEE